MNSSPQPNPDEQGLTLACRAIAYIKLRRTDEAWADFSALEKLALPLPSHDSILPDLINVDHLAMCIAYEEANALLTKTFEAETLLERPGFNLLHSPEPSSGAPAC